MVTKPNTSTLEIHVLGGFECFVDGRPVHEQLARSRKAQRLVTMLALADGHRLHRDQALDALWPDLDPPSASNQLYKAVHLIRRVLEPGLEPRAVSRYLGSGEFLQLRAGGGVLVDAKTFSESARAALDTRSVVDLERCSSSYVGDLLPDERYESWTDEPRERLRRLRRNVLCRLAIEYGAVDRNDEAVACYATVLDAEPSDERAHRGLMRVYLRTGRLNRAIEQYRACRVALARDLDTEPDPKTNALYEKVRAAQMEALPAPERAVAPRAAAAPRRRRIPTRAAMRVGLSLAVALGCLAVTENWATLAAKAERYRARAVSTIASIRGEQSRVVTVRGSVARPHVRVELLGSVSGLACVTDDDGAFALPSALACPGPAGTLLVTSVDDGTPLGSAAVPAVAGRDGVIDLGRIALQAPIATAVPTSARTSVEFVAPERVDREFLRGAFVAITVHERSDEAKLMRLNEFVASRYVDDDTPRDASPRRTLEQGSHWSGGLALAFASAAEAAGYEVRMIDLAAASSPDRTHSIVEVRYDGRWHAFDPAFGFCVDGPNGGLASYDDLLRDPSLVRLDVFFAKPRRGWAPESIALRYGSGIHRYRYLSAQARAE